MRVPTTVSLRGAVVVGGGRVAPRTSSSSSRVAVVSLAAVASLSSTSSSSSSSPSFPRNRTARDQVGAREDAFSSSLPRSAKRKESLPRRRHQRRVSIATSAAAVTETTSTATTISEPTTSTSTSSSSSSAPSTTKKSKPAKSPWPSAVSPPPPPGTVADVDEIIGVRVVVGEEGRPQAQYLVKWASASSSKKSKEKDKKKKENDGKKKKNDADEDEEEDNSDPHPAPTWEPTANVADNLLRDYEQRWWAACRDGDAPAVRRMLAGGAKVLSRCVDDDRRSGLHYAAGKGSAETVALLCAAGAKLDLPDKDGYTPLHMAVGYSHTRCVAALLAAGADPEVADRAGRDVVRLVESIRASTPPAPELMARRVALEQAAALLADHLFEEVEPARVLRARRVPVPLPPGAPPGTRAPTIREFLVQWPDGKEDSWVPQGDLAQDVVDDFDAGLDYAPARALLRERVRGDGREFLVRWEGGGGGGGDGDGGGAGDGDGAGGREEEGEEDSWEPEENVAVSLVREWDERKRERAEKLAASGGDGGEGGE